MCTNLTSYAYATPAPPARVGVHRSVVPPKTRLWRTPARAFVARALARSRVARE